MNSRTMRFAGVALATAALTLTACSDGSTPETEEYPAKTITLVVPGAAGSSNDSIARQIATQMEAELGQTIVVENSSTETQAMVQLKNADPDGYTFAIGALNLLTLFPLTQEAGYSAGLEDFDVVATTDSSPVVLLVNADSPFTSLDDFVAHEGVVSIAAPNGRGVPAIDIELLAQISELEYNYVGFPPGEQMVALLNGTAQAAMSQTPLAAQYIQSGQMRALALFNDQRLEGFDAPLAVEQGYDVTYAPIRLVLVPKGTPAEIVAALEAAVKSAVESPSFVDFAATSYFIPSFVPAAEAKAIVEQNLTESRQIGQQLGWID